MKHHIILNDSSPFKKHLCQGFLNEIEILKDQLVIEKKYENILEIQGKIHGIHRCLAIFDEIERMFYQKFAPPNEELQEKL